MIWIPPNGIVSEKINFPDINYVKNENYEKTNMLNALFLVPEKLEGSVIISYGDIIYEWPLCVLRCL